MTREEILSIAKPILFNTKMVRATQDNIKTVTRRALKPHNPVKAKKCGYYQGSGLYYDNEFNIGDKDTHIKDYTVSCCWIGTKIYIKKYAPYKVGDYLYVRETWARIGCDVDSIWFEEPEKLYDGQIIYRTDFTEDIPECRWHPSIHMPKEAARIFIRVTNVRVERLQDITEEQARKEGVDFVKPFFCKDKNCDLCNGHEYCQAYVHEFKPIWGSTIKKSDLAIYGWDANPWVWVIEFERVEVE